MFDWQGIWVALFIESVDLIFPPNPFLHHSVLLSLQDINELEVIGSGKPFNLVTVCNSPLLENEEEEEEDKEHKEMNNKNVWDRNYLMIY